MSTYRKCDKCGVDVVDIQPESFRYELKGDISGGRLVVVKPYFDLCLDCFNELGFLSHREVKR